MSLNSMNNAIRKIVRYLKVDIFYLFKLRLSNYNNLDLLI